MVKKQTPDNMRWVTLAAHDETSPLHMRRVLIKSDGTVMACKVPRAFHGKKVNHLETLHKAKKNPYAEYSKSEITEVLQHFTKEKDAADRELKSMVHDFTRAMNGPDPRNELVKRLTRIGGIKAPKKGQAYYREWIESVPGGIKRATARANGRKLDEAADELSMSARDLIDALSQTPRKESGLSRVDALKDPEVQKQKRDIATLQKQISLLKAALKSA